METHGLFPDNRDRLLPDMEGWMPHMQGCIPGVEGARSCKKDEIPGPPPSQGMNQNKVAPHPPLAPPLRPSLLLFCTRTVVSHPRAQPMVRELGRTNQLNGGSGTEMAPPPKGRRPLATHEAGLFAVFAARRAQPNSADSLPP